jgi:hypothetical protein
MNPEKFLSKFIIASIVMIGCMMISKESIAQPAGCETEVQVLAKADRFGAAFQKLDRVATAAAVLFYDSIPPASQSVADTAALVHMRDGSGVVLLGNRGMYCENVVVGSDHWQAVVRSILGITS